MKSLNCRRLEKTHLWGDVVFQIRSWMWLGAATLNSASGLEAICRHQKSSFNPSVSDSTLNSGILLAS